MELDFEFGKPQRGGNRRREFVLLGLILSVSSLPYGILLWFDWVATGTLVCFVAGFKVLATFVSSLQTDTSHHIRFLLAGSNPIGMTGASSMLLGAVDSVLDWHEDAKSRRKRPLRFAILTAVKFLLTPIGLLLMVVEICWDVLLLRRGFQMVKVKLSEFFSLANFHNVICPEKSNDIFYADMAYARYRNDPYHYQWVRMRSMVFELEHYKLDVLEGIGDPKSNLFLQDEITAYNTLKYLRIEEIEVALDLHYSEQPDSFLFPRTITRRLVRNARPIRHYLRIQKELKSTSCRQRSKVEDELNSIVEAMNRRILEQWPDGRSITVWELLRLLDGEPYPSSAYLPPSFIDQLVRCGVLETAPRNRKAIFYLQTPFGEMFECFLKKHFVEKQTVRMSTSASVRRLRYLDREYALRS